MGLIALLKGLCYIWNRLSKGLKQIKFLREDEMFEVSEKAGEMIKDAFKEKKEIPSIRIVFNEGG